MLVPSVGIVSGRVRRADGDTPDGNLCELRFASPPTVPASSGDRRAFL